MTPTLPISTLTDMPHLETHTQPSRSYRLDAVGKHIVGTVDGIDAVTQAIYKTLATERYAWLIYDWSLGVELEQYLGMSIDFVKADLERAVTEALAVDDRILEIKNFYLRQVAVDALYVEFVAITTKGTAQITWEVKLP